MSRNYVPRPWDETTGVSFEQGNARRNGEGVHMLKKKSYAPPPSRLERVRETWSERKPYYIIYFLVGLLVVIGAVLFYYATLQP